MPRFDPTEFGRLLARLTPQELRQVEGLVADARKRAEAVLELAPFSTGHLGITMEA